MKGHLIDPQVLIAILMTIVTLAVVITFFTRNFVKFSEFIYLVYNIQASNHIAYTSENFGVVNPDTLDNTDFNGKKALLIMIYDLRDKKIIYSNSDNNILSNGEIKKFFEKSITEMKSRVPGTPGKNYHTDERIEQLISVLPQPEIIKKALPEVAFSEYAMPVLVKRGKDLHPALLVIVSNNAEINIETEGAKDVLTRFDWVSGTE